MTNGKRPREKLLPGLPFKMDAKSLQQSYNITFGSRFTKNECF